MKFKRGILWLRNDLRLHDQEALYRAVANCEEIYPVFCLDPRQFAEDQFGFQKTGPFRTQFLKESLEDLHQRLKEKGSTLILRQGKPEEVLPALVAEGEIEAVFAHKEVTAEEVQVETAVENALFKAGISLNLYWGSTLYHLEDLPMPMNALPDVFTQFRKQVEKMASVRELFPTPAAISTQTALFKSDIFPSFEALGQTAPVPDERAVLPFKGGEIAGIERLQDYFWEKDCLKTYKETRNGLLGSDYSSKFSAWLALGCLSPRYIYQEVKRYEKLRKKNSSTYWLIFELIWRDYFRFVSHRYGNDLFKVGGIKRESRKWSQHAQRFEAWKNGETGVPFVDANMKELLHTGFMSNRGRQNVASFLVRDLGLDWRMGAAWFESQLVDYDVCSNWGNWNYVAGIGNDPREDRYFNTVSQARRYDSQGEYIKTWLPALRGLSSNMVHAPWEHRDQALKAHGVEPGVDYPRPIISWGKAHAKHH